MRTELKFGLIGGVLVLVAAFVGYSLWSGGDKPADKPLDTPGKAVVGDSARTVKDESRTPVTPPRDTRQPATPPRTGTDPARPASTPPRVPQPGDAERPRVSPTPSDPAPAAPSTGAQGASTATPPATPATGAPARPTPTTPSPGPTLPQAPPPSTATPGPTPPATDSRTPTTPGASPATPTNTTINVPPPRTPTTPPSAGSGNPGGAVPGGNTVSTHTVSDGETLSSIAKSYYGDAKYWSAIVAANPKLNPNRLKLGQVLNMPARADVIAGTVRPPAAPEKRDAGGATSRPAPAARPEPPKTPPAVAPATYKVGRGDTLTSIARNVLKDGNRWREIYELNKDKLPSPDDLEEGMELKLPAPRSQ